MDKKPRTGQKSPKDVEDELDEALAGTFPASDPPSMTEPKSRVGHAKRKDHSPASSK